MRYSSWSWSCQSAFHTLHLYLKDESCSCTLRKTRCLLICLGLLQSELNRVQSGSNRLRTFLQAYLGLPRALVFLYLFVWSKQRSSFHPKALNEEQNAQLENCSGVCVCVSANFRSFPTDFRSCSISAHFPGENWLSSGFRALHTFPPKT